MFIRKEELVQALHEYEQNKRWYNPSTWDDAAIIMLRKFVYEHLDGVQGTEEIAYENFLRYLADNGQSNLLNDDYLQSSANSRYIFLTWQQNGTLGKLPIETWRHVMNFLSQQDVKRLASTCYFFHEYAADEALIEKLPFAPRDYSEAPMIYELPEVALVAPQPNGKFVYGMSYSWQYWFNEKENFLHVIDLLTMKIVEKHRANLSFFSYDALHALHLMANGNLLLISSSGAMHLLDPKTGKSIKDINKFLDLGPAYHYLDDLAILPEENSLVFYPPKNNDPMPHMYYPVDAEHPNELYVVNIDTGHGHYMPSLPDSNSIDKVKIKDRTHVTLQDRDIHLPDDREEAQLFLANALPTGDILYGYHLNDGYNGCDFMRKMYIAHFPELKPVLRAEENENVSENRFRIM